MGTNKYNDNLIKTFELAQRYLKEITPDNVGPLERYFLGYNNGYTSLKDVYIQFIASAQNYQSMPNIIKFYERKEQISAILKGFNYNEIKDWDVEDLYRAFKNEFHFGGVDGKRNSWHKWSKSVIDSANFVSGFKDVKDFNNFVNSFDGHVYGRMVLPLLISEKITGIGFALACDALKELGFTNYPKPDVHLIDIFSELGLSDKTQMSAFEAIVKMTDQYKTIDPTITAYKVDKTFWLICSGTYYLEDPLVKSKSHKKEFIATAKESLGI